MGQFTFIISSKRAGTCRDDNDQSYDVVEDRYRRFFRTLSCRIGEGYCTVSESQIQINNINADYFLS